MTCTESIYNLIPKPASKEMKKPTYRSKYDPNAPISGSTFGLHGTSFTVGRGVNELKKICAVSSTFGPTKASSTPSDPSHFLRRGSGTTNKPTTSKPSEPPPRLSKASKLVQKQKPPVPSSNDKPIQGLVTSRNYITANAIEAIISSPKKRQEENVNYLAKEDYGKVPQYLNKVKKEIQREQRLVDQCVKDHEAMSSSTSINSGLSRNSALDGGHHDSDSTGYEVMDERERHELICALKSKWDEVNSTYQKICHRVAIDSLGDIKRKEAQEAELQQLENDIEKLSKPGPLYIVKD